VNTEGSDDWTSGANLVSEGNSIFSTTSFNT
jgi:hypothetical protein